MSALGPALIDALNALDAAEKAEVRLALGLAEPIPPAPADPTEVQPLLTVAQAAQRLGVHVETIRRAIRSGALPAVRVGRSWRIAPSELDAWLAGPKRIEGPSISPRRRRRGPKAASRPMADALRAIRSTE